MIDALELELNYIQHLNPTFAVEVGPGSGIISTALATALPNQGESKLQCIVFACDINLSACTATLRTASQNNVSASLEVICTDLLVGLTDRCFGKIDLGR